MALEFVKVPFKEGTNTQIKLFVMTIKALLEKNTTQECFCL
jgi:hypothetical protein